MFWKVVPMLHHALFLWQKYWQTQFSSKGSTKKTQREINDGNIWNHKSRSKKTTNFYSRDMNNLEKDLVALTRKRKFFLIESIVNQLKCSFNLKTILKINTLQLFNFFLWISIFVFETSVKFQHSFRPFQDNFS